MSFENVLKEVQQSLSEKGIEGWLLADDHGRNSLAYEFLGIPIGKMLTRRFFYWIPKQGDPVKIVPKIEPYTLDHLPGNKLFYRSWQEMERILGSLLHFVRNIVMEYSPRHALPNVSKVDGGMIDLIRSYDVEIASSANLLQKYTSVWRDEQLETHRQAAKSLCDIVDETWHYINSAVSENRKVTEYQVQQFMLEGMKKRGCVTADSPICAVNAHSADPHYSPEEGSASEIRKGDFVLLDLWCKQSKPQAVYADITRVGIVQAFPTAKQTEVFNIVKAARDAASKFVAHRFAHREPVQGWEVDQVCRDVIASAGYGDLFIHRTGHNIGQEVHGSGTNMDNFETHDFRQILPGTCFSIEPGIYIPGEFGVRLEYDMYVHKDGRVEITGGIQDKL